MGIYLFNEVIHACVIDLFKFVRLGKEALTSLSSHFTFSGNFVLFILVSRTGYK